MPLHGEEVQLAHTGTRRGECRPRSCYLCGRGEDSIQHIFGGECEAVVAARTSVNRVLKFYGNKTDFPDLDPVVLNAADYWSSSLLAFPRPGTTLDPKLREQAVFAISLFNAVVWYERVYYFRLLVTPPHLPQAVDRLTSMVALEFLRLRTKGRPSSTPGAAQRKKERKEVARTLAKKAIASLPHRTLVAFTDGSANPNPGPAGAGAFIYSTTPNDTWNNEAIAALGAGTNNLGEIWGIGMAVQMAIQRLGVTPLGTYSRLQIFTDSVFARNCVLGEWNSPTYRDVIESVRRLVAQLPPRITFSIDWVPAHVGIPENEHADFLAGCGSRWSSSRRTNVDTKTDHVTGDFLPGKVLVRQGGHPH